MKWDKEYQEMCEGAEELQEGWKPKEGDWFYAKEWSKVCMWSECTSFYKHYVWLPSQEDLQEMVINLPNTILPWTLIERFFKWTLKIYTHDFGDTSMTKLWLAYTMHQLYAKNWNPETKKWEKTEE